MDNVLLNSVLSFHEKSVQVVLTSSHIIWYPQERGIAYPTTSDGSFHKVILQEVIAIRYMTDSGKKKKQKSDEIELLPNNIFAIHSIVRCKNHKWRCKRSVFHCNDSATCQNWVETIRKNLIGFDRPSKLLIFINPVGGKKQANKIYKEKVAPLLTLADIKQDVIVTERANHAHDYVMSENLDGYDGIIAVGGDGMFSEILNGVLASGEQSSNGNMKSKSTIKLGIIPAGSTDTIVFCTSGINDPMTAALHIIIGDKLSVDVCSVWHENKLLKYSVSLMGYGFFGDVIRDSQQLRWMGPRRYDLAGFRRFMANRSYSGEISYLPAPIDDADPLKRQTCVAGCLRCAESDETREAESENDDRKSWRTIQGQFISVIGANITCRCAKSLDGISPNAHLGDGFFDLILIRKTSRTQYLRHMMRLANRGDLFGFDFIDVHRVKEFKFRPLASYIIENEVTDHDPRYEDNQNGDLILEDVPRASPRGNRQAEESVWNIDGELVEKPNLHVKNHRKLITLFARGIEVFEETPTCGSCRNSSLEEE